MTLRTNTTRHNLLLLPGLVGFFLSARAVLAVLWFSQELQQASILSVSVSVTLLAVVALSTIGSAPSSSLSALRNSVLRWIAIFFAVNFASLLWTEAPPEAATVYLLAWAADVATILLLLRDGSAERQAAAIMKGYVWGAGLVCVVAWSLPTLPDLRLGDVDILHPNAIGFTSSVGALISMHLSHEKKAWRWAAVGLVLTLVRTISKTSIFAFLITGIVYLFTNANLTRAIKVRMGLVGAAIIASLSVPLAAYFENYSESTDPSTLTGRTFIWSTATEIAMKTPLLGHGFYSFRSLMPALGTFEPQHAHNEIIQQFFCLGCLGVIVMIVVFWTVFRQIRRAPRSSVKSLAAALLLFGLLHGVTDTSEFDLSYPLWLMAMLSILLAIPVDQPEPLATFAPAGAEEDAHAH